MARQNSTCDLSWIISSSSGLRSLRTWSRPSWRIASSLFSCTVAALAETQNALCLFFAWFKSSSLELNPAKHEKQQKRLLMQFIVSKLLIFKFLWSRILFTFNPCNQHFKTTLCSDKCQSALTNLNIVEIWKVPQSHFCKYPGPTN